MHHPLETSIRTTTNPSVQHLRTPEVITNLSPHAVHATKTKRIQSGCTDAKKHPA
jgi:hypothetical protein